MTTKQITFEHVSKVLEVTIECSFTPDLAGPMDLTFARKGEARSLVKEKPEVKEPAKEEVKLPRPAPTALTLESFPPQEQEWLLAQSLALNDQWIRDQGTVPTPAPDEPESEADTLLKKVAVLIKHSLQGQANLTALSESIQRYLDGVRKK